MHIPLSEKLRPEKLDEIVGQEHLIGQDGLIPRLVREKKPLSILLWGPPGCGKTTLAAAYAHAFSAHYIPVIAVTTPISLLKKLVDDFQAQPLIYRQPHIFVDEIHRYNKAQQDFFLPYLEKGTFVLIGATTENPSFTLNNALLSRMRILVLNPHTVESLEKILERYEKRIGPLPLNPEARTYLIHLSQGDGRYILNLIETLQGIPLNPLLGVLELQALLQKRAPLFDRNGEYHYNLISALHKSVRGSDPDASLYWFCRMLDGGEDPLFLARRMIRMASEDVGLADPQALPFVIAAKQSYEHLGSPEGELALAQAVIYLALAPKSNSSYVAYNHARKSASETSQASPPAHIVNAPTRVMKDLGYGKDYAYDHDTENCFSGQNYFPDDMEREEYYQPREWGFEREMHKRLGYFKKLRDKINGRQNPGASPGGSPGGSNL